MSITVKVNGNTVANGGFARGDDQPIASGEAVDAVEISTSGSISLLSMALADWSKRVVFTPGVSFPHTVVNGVPLNCTIGSVNPPLLTGEDPLPGAPYARLTISYMEAGNLLSFVLEYAVLLVDASLDENDFPDFAGYFADWFFDEYGFGSAAPTPDNPLGLGWGLENPSGGGHLAWAQAYLPTAASQGLVNVLMFLPAGALHRVQVPFTGDFVFDWWQMAREYALVSGHTQNYDTFEAALDWMIDHGLTPWIYMGTLRQDADFLALRLDPGGFVGRILYNVNWGLRRNVGFMFDSPYSRSVDISAENPHIIAGEQRYESLNWVRQIKETQGLATYVEPRGPAGETDWLDWGHVALDPALTRANPDWYADAAGVASDAQITGPIADLLVDGSNQVLPFQLAELYSRGYQAISNVSFYWVNAGGTLDNLWSWVRYYVRVIRGFTPGVAPAEETPPRPDPPFDVDPDGPP